MCKGDKGDPLTDRLKALADTVNMAIVGVLTAHRPDPVPVKQITGEIGGISRRVVSGRLAKLRRVELVKLAGGRQKGYMLETGQIRAVIGEENYTRFWGSQNEDTPGQR